MSIINLPDDIKTNILSYLYFSSNTLNNMTPNLFLIKNYSELFYDAFDVLFDHDTELLNKMILRFLLKDEHYQIYDKLVYYNVEINYEIFSTYQVKSILTHLNVLETNKMYTFCRCQ